MSWHVDELALARWADGADGGTTGASIEAHLLRCADCRARLPRPAALDAVWTRVRDEIELPRPSRLERLLGAMRLPANDARILAVGPAFRAAWGSALVLLLAFVVLAASWDGQRGQWVFVLVAPLIPVIGVVMCYDPELEPALEQETAAPYSRLRLVLLRSAALLATGVPVTLAASAVLPWHLAVLWLLPALGFTAAVLAMSTWMPPLRAGAVVVAGWVLVVSLAARGGPAGRVLDHDYALAYALLILAAGTVLVRRGRHLELIWDGS
jgi:hypothetical protein